jgi:hypothetical protein
MEVSFAKNPEANPATPAEVQVEAKTEVVNTMPTDLKSANPAPAPATAAVATIPQAPMQIAPRGVVLGDRIPDFKDIILPRINIVQGLGELNKSFPLGAIVYNQALVLCSPAVVNAKTGNVERPATPPVIITILGFRPTRFVEKTSGGARGLLVNTEAEVRANGGTLNYKEWQLKAGAGMKYFQELAEAFIVIQKPDSLPDDGSTFVYEVDGKKCTLALWGMKGSSYTAGAKVFFTARSLNCLRGGYPTHSYCLSTRLKPFDGGKEAWVPVPVPHLKSSPEFMAFAASILEAPATDAPEAE